MSASPRLSATIAICTYSRAQLLRETLRTLLRQDYPRELFEVLVIDNNSPDEMTQAVVESLAASDAELRLRYVYEPRQGLSHARNRALVEGSGEVIVFADDDILVEPEWLRTLLRPIENDPDKRIAVVGGEVVPVFPEGVAPWGHTFYAPLRLRDDAGPIGPSEVPMGANVAFRAEHLRAVGRFDPTVGRIGPGLLAGDENRPVDRLRAQGYDVWFVPAARVFHQMPRSRTTLRYVARHAFGSACSRVMNQTCALHDAGQSPLPYLLTRFLANLGKALVFSLQGLVATVLCQPASASPAWIRVWRSFGYIRQTSTSLFELTRPRRRRPLDVVKSVKPGTAAVVDP